MITNSIINFVFSVFDWVFALLPIPAMPEWIDSVLSRICDTVSDGVSMFTWIFPPDLYTYVIDTCLTCLVVRVSYDIYTHFHKLKTGT